jgi:Holliday junction resolvasome RuvABC DNA-binding subunit
LKRFVDKRSDGIARKLTRRIDGHGFAIWQVVNDLEAPNPVPERPAKADMVRSALTGTGYRWAEADYAVSALGAKVDTEPVAELVREALAVLAGRSAPGLQPKGR